MQVHFFVLDALPEVLDEEIVTQAPFPSMLIWMPGCTRPMKAMLVNWLL